jgi:hypothetical protein
VRSLVDHLVACPSQELTEAVTALTSNSSASKKQEAVNE